MGRLCARIALLVPVAIVLTTAANAKDKPPKIQSFQIVDGKRYRVVLRGNTGYVKNKAAFVMMNPEEVFRRKKAAELASGCKVVDSQIIETAVFVQLECPSTPSSHPPP